ncbi:hypothetical protein L6452_20216 [Arctium lappa]|uniref:Uncharacterized protein n=1 Tax=Arctium lappa TaxID=4217 RepID=A0ACB9BBL8_ARCLA|nr:hypothetical protein L6452_20216 [Arctium lappa]
MDAATVSLALLPSLDTKEKHPNIDLIKDENQFTGFLSLLPISILKEPPTAPLSVRLVLISAIYLYKTLQNRIQIALHKSY